MTADDDANAPHYCNSTTLSRRIVYTYVTATSYDKEHPSTMFFRKNRMPSSNELLPKEPVVTGPVNEWFEVALCERADEGQFIIKDIKRSFTPDWTFTEGLHPDRYYALASRRVEIRDDAIITEDWSGLREWRKPNRPR